ncbi:hypothetical protein ACFYSH_07965 [Streptomyces sp. NPDC005791]
MLAVPPSPLEKELAAVRRGITWRLPLHTRALTGPVPAPQSPDRRQAS